MVLKSIFLGVLLKSIFFFFVDFVLFLELEGIVLLGYIYKNI